MSVQNRSVRVVTAGVLLSLGTLLVSATPATAAPARADLVLTTTFDRTEIPAPGGSATLTVGLRNAGAKASQEAVVKFTLPPGAQFPTDGWSPPAGWTCELLGAASCTHSPLAAGAVAENVAIPMAIPSGTAGDSLTVSATVSGGTESSTANNTDEAVIRYLPGFLDLAVDPATTTQELVRGERAALNTSVRNTGNITSGDITVVAALPAGTRAAETSPESWDCSFGEGLADGRTGWRCTHAPLTPGQTTEPVSLSAELVDVQPGDTVTLAATVSSTTPETDTTNNTAEDVVTVVPWAVVRGIVWLNTDFNTVRDEGENGIPDVGAIDRVVVSPQAGGQATWATVNPDGTYQAYVRAGSYRVEFTVWQPYEFIDSVDSDLIYHEHVLGASSAYGYTDWFTTAGGDEVVLDAGVRG